MERRDYVDAAHRFCAARRLPLVLIVHDAWSRSIWCMPRSAKAQIGLERGHLPLRFGPVVRESGDGGLTSTDLWRAGNGPVPQPFRKPLTPRPSEDSLHLKSPRSPDHLGYAGSLAYGYGTPYPSR